MIEVLKQKDVKKQTDQNNQTTETVNEIDKSNTREHIKSLKLLLINKLNQKIITESRDHKKAFKHTPLWFKTATFTLMLLESYLLMSNIEAVIEDNRQGAKLDMISFAVENGTKSVDGSGGFFYDLCNFFAETTAIVSSFSDVNKS